MPFATKEEAEAKVKELEQAIGELKAEVKEVTRESMSRKDAVKKADEALKKYIEVLKKRGVEDFDGDIGEQLDKGSGKDESEKTLKTYERRMKQAEETITTLTKAKEESDRKVTHAKFTETLSKQMQDIIGAHDLIENLILRERVKDDKGKIVCLNSEGDEFTVEKFIEDYKKKNPERVKVQQQSGGGSSSGGSGNQTSGEPGKTIKNSEYQKMHFDAKKKFLENPNNHIEE